MKIAILGAECSGKSTLSHALAAPLADIYPEVTVVDEYLRTWCDAHGRPPRAHEQAHVAHMQAQRIQTAPAACVIADTTPLVTAVYSDVLFDDLMLYTEAIAFQRTLDVTLVMGLDVAWVADGIQRDGLAIRQRIDARLREVLLAHQIPFASVYGQGPQRTEAALTALTHAATKHRAVLEGGQPWVWMCDTCSDAACEHRLFRRLTHKSMGN